MRTVSSTREIDALLAAGAPVAIGVSGGKDSSAVAFATVAYLDAAGHSGPRILIHSDLGRTEWKASLPGCEALAARLGLDLVVVRRRAGDMLARWEGRWAANVKRWVELSCVKLILPWSTASMRFCTSELKTDIICSELRRRFAGRTILSVTGIRREESEARSEAPVAKPQPKLTTRTKGTAGLDWHPIVEWKIDDVLGYLDEKDFPLHEAYTVYGSSRVSCAFCILGSRADLAAASSCPDNAALYRAMCALETASTFSFQERWLSDLAPHLLSEEQRVTVPAAKARARAREDAEGRLPKHLLYTKGWPTCVPTLDEAQLIADVRRDVAQAVGLAITFTDPHEVIARYRALLAAKAQRQ